MSKMHNKYLDRRVGRQKKRNGKTIKCLGPSALRKGLQKSFWFSELACLHLWGCYIQRLQIDNSEVNRRNFKDQNLFYKAIIDNNEMRTERSKSKLPSGVLDEAKNCGAKSNSSDLCYYKCTSPGRSSNNQVCFSSNCFLSRFSQVHPLKEAVPVEVDKLRNKGLQILCSKPLVQRKHLLRRNRFPEDIRNIPAKNEICVTKCVFDKRKRN